MEHKNNNICTDKTCNEKGKSQEEDDDDDDNNTNVSCLIEVDKKRRTEDNDDDDGGVDCCIEEKRKRKETNEKIMQEDDNSSNNKSSNKRARHISEEEEEGTVQSNVEMTDSICESLSMNNKSLNEQPSKNGKDNSSKAIISDAVDVHQNNKKSKQTPNNNNPNNNNNKSNKNNNQNKKNKKKKKLKKDPSTIEFRRSIQLCCSDDNYPKAIQLYQKAIKDNNNIITIEAQTYYNLLNLCDGLTYRGNIHIGTPRQTNKTSKTATVTAVADSKEQSKTASAPACTDASAPETTNDEIVDESNQKSESSMTTEKETPIQSTHQETTTTTTNNDHDMENIDDSVEARLKTAFDIKAHMDSISLPLNETAYTALIRILSKSTSASTAAHIELSSIPLLPKQKKLLLNDISTTTTTKTTVDPLLVAEYMLNEAEETSQCRPKLRLYSPLLCAYALRGQTSKALTIWNRMFHISNPTTTIATGRGDGESGMISPIVPTEREYMALIQGATITADAPLMDRILSDLAEDVLVPGYDTTHAIIQWFQPHDRKEKEEEEKKEREQCDSMKTIVGSLAKTEEEYNERITKSVLAPSQNTTTTTTTTTTLLPPSDAPSMGPLVSIGPTSHWLISMNCTINTTTGILTSGCLQGRTLRPIQVSQKSWNQMMEMNETIVLRGMLENDKSLFQGGRKGLKQKFSSKSEMAQRRQRKWDSFKRYLMNRVGPPLGSNTTTTTTATIATCPHSSSERKDEIVDTKNGEENKTTDATTTTNVDSPLDVPKKEKDCTMTDPKTTPESLKKSSKEDPSSSSSSSSNRQQQQQQHSSSSPSSTKKQQLSHSSSKNRPKKPYYDVVIDGANVGYYKQNFAGSPKHVDYHQIDWVVQHFLQNKHNTSTNANNNNNTNNNTDKSSMSVLLVLHERHFHPNLMPSYAKPIVQSWDQSGILYRAPFGSNDDWFWLHAALWCQSSFVITNDEMRDHHFQMLAPRSFLRWKERHQVHFTFGDWYTLPSSSSSSNNNNGREKEQEQERRQRRVELTYPEIYSRRIQRIDMDGLVIPIPKQGDINRFLDGIHDADETSKAPIEETYVCIKMCH